MKTTLNLSTTPGTDLKAHTNHKVEVTGTVAAAKAGMQSGALSSPPSSAQAGAASGHAVHQDFTVESVKMVSSTCP